MLASLRVEFLRLSRLPFYVYLLALAFLGAGWLGGAGFEDTFPLLTVLMLLPHTATDGYWKTNAPDLYLLSRTGRSAETMLTRFLWVSILGLVSCALLLAIASNTRALFSETAQIEVTPELISRLTFLGDSLARPLVAQVGRTIEVPPYGSAILSLYFGAYLFFGTLISRPKMNMAWGMALYFVVLFAVAFLLKSVRDAGPWFYAQYGLLAAAVFVLGAGLVAAWNVRSWRRTSW